MISLTIHLYQTAIILQITHIKQLIVGKPVLPPHREVGCNVVQLAEETAELHVSGIVKMGAAEDEDAMLEYTM